MPPKSNKKKKKTFKNKKGFLIGLAVFVAVLLIIGGIGLYFLKKDSVKVKGKGSAFLYIPTNATISNVADSLTANHYIKDTSYFRWLADRMNYTSSVRSGRYEIKNGMTLHSLIAMLKTGKQKPVMVSIQKSRTKSDFAGKISKKLEVDSLELLNLLNDEPFLDQYGLNPETALTLIIPNSYEFYWNTSAEKFLNKMDKENRRFWDAERLEKAKNINLTPIEVAILASIVDEETNRSDEKANVASVYLNRLRIGMKLQADPTVRFAASNFTANRVVNKHLVVDSPYNTYEHFGLPPGPICISSISSIDAVLANKKTNYLYFCANPDFSGYHTFTSSYNEHLNNASKYHQELNRRKIMK